MKTTKRAGRAGRSLPQQGDREVRRWSLGELELREANGSLTLTGYASVVEVPYEMYGGPPWGWSETIAAGAFDKSLSEQPDVQLLINHEGMPLGRTKSGTLRLSADDHGLRVEADLDPHDPDVVALRGKMARGDIDEMSFAFRVSRQDWDDDYVDRRITEINLAKGDVSIVNYGANPATSVQLRRLADIRAAATGPDSDEDPGALAQAVDAILDELEEALALNDIPTVSALLTGAQATIDTLLEVLGAADADDAPEPDEPPARGMSLAEARRLLEPIPA